MNEKPRMKIFIDLSNIEQGIRDYRDYGISVDYRELVNIVSDGYEVVGMYVYDGKPEDGKAGNGLFAPGSERTGVRSNRAGMFSACQ